MKRNPLFVLLAAVVCLVGCGETGTEADAAPAAVDASTGNASKPADAAAHPDWTTDVEQAKQTAAADGKALFLYFTGTDWCVPCIVLDKELLTTEPFDEWADERVVPVLLDFPAPTPDNPTPGEHKELALRYGIRGFPTIVMTDPEGRPFATVLHRGVESAFQDIKAGYANREKRDTAFAKADAAEGLDAARALDQGLAAVGIANALEFYSDEVDRIIELDADNEAGLKERYEQARTDLKVDEVVQQAYQNLAKQDLDGAADRIDDALALNPSPGLRQALTAFKAQVRLEQGRKDEGLGLLDEALQIAPDSQIAPQIRQLKQQAGGG